MPEYKELTFEQRVADPIGAAIGNFGRWHLWMCFLIFLTKFPVGWHQLSIVFLAPKVDFECVDPDNQTDKCSAACKKVEYDRSTFKETIVTEWDLVCGRSYLASLSQTVFMFGILVGNVSFGIWADKIGRQPPMVLSLVLQLIVGVILAILPWFWLFCIFRFLLGLATGGGMMTSFVLLMEITCAKNREVMGILYHVPFNGGHALLPAFAYNLRHWRGFQFALSIVSAIYLPYYWIVPESPRWLMVAGRIDESAAILEAAAKMNGRPTTTIRGDLEEASRRIHAQAIRRGTLVDLFRHPNLRCKTICISYNWFVCGLAYFGVSQYISQLGGNIFINVAFSGCIAIPGTVASICSGKYLGRKWSLIISNTLCGCAMLIISVLSEDHDIAKVILGSIGVFSMASTFAIVYIFSGELFPTVVRNAGMGFASMIARCGSMSAPFVLHTSAISTSLPPIIFAIVPLIGTCLVFLLPETLGAPLPETIEDAENFGKIIKIKIPNRMSLRRSI